jgi:catechol 2,3-dioxygenase-like lactoylglutathione lyase family enzyme/2'-5' RNA ligase
LTYVIMLTLDADASETVLDLRRRMDRVGIPVDIDDPPHVSLASCGQLDIEAALTDVADIAAMFGRVTLSFEGVGSFLSEEGTVYLAPVLEERLSALQRRSMTVITTYGSNINPYYAAGRWVPHCTVANRLSPSDRVVAMALCMESKAAFQAGTIALELVEFGNGPAVYHGAFPLGTVPSAILGVDHIQITIPTGDEDRGRQFYCQLLGLTEIDKPASLAGRGGFWLQVGDRQVHVGTEADFDRSVTKAHIAYAVVGLDRWRSTLVGNGIEILDGVPIPGFDRFEFRDPFGNRVELIEAGGV